MAYLHKTQQSFSNWAADELRPAVLGTGLVSGLMIYMLEIIFTVSFAALIFSGGLASHLPQALGFIIMGDAILCLMGALLSSYSGSISVQQDTPGAVLGLAAVAIAAAIPASASAQQYATVVMMIIISTLMTGALFLVLGIFKLGSFVRFLPYPVMGGFLAGTGWLLAKGGIGVMVSAPFGMEWLASSSLIHWLPGMFLGIFIYGVTRKINKSLAIPGILIFATILFYLVTITMKITVVQLQSDGWLLGNFPSGSLWQFPLTTNTISQVDWPVLLKQIPSLVSAAIISIIALLLNFSGLELVTKKDVDLNRELIAAGIGNLSAGIFGGLIGYPSISLSTLNHAMSGGKRLVGIIAALLVGVTIFFGASALVFIPKFILGSILAFLGIGLLVEWVYEAWFKFPKIDFVIILSILGIIVLSGFLNGIIVGLVMAVIMFVVSYSQVSVIKFALTGQDYHSRVTRHPFQQKLLEQHSGQLYILKLHGFIFFGTANSIFNQVRTHIKAASAQPVKFILLDLTQVSGLDSTGLLSFTRMIQWSQEKGITLVLSGLNGRTLDQFAKGGFTDKTDGIRLCVDMDHGIEWCEEQIIASVLVTDPTKENTLRDYLRSTISDEEQIERIANRMQRRDIQAGEHIIHQNDQADEIFFIESGQVTAHLETPGKTPIRLETMEGGRIFGEVAFFLDINRTASVVADQPSVIYSLSRETLKTMISDDPQTAYAFQGFIVHSLGQRVMHLTHVVNALQW